MACDSTETMRKHHDPIVFSRSHRCCLVLFLFSLHLNLEMLQFEREKSFKNLSIGLSLAGTKSILKLAQRMKLNFYSGITASCIHKWEKLLAENVGQDMRILTRKSLEPSGIVLSAATSLWLPVTQQRLFEFLCDGKCRNQWDILSNGASMENTLLVPKGQRKGSCVSLLRAAVSL